jgi:Xaa-Pro aminopeptidase
MHVLAGVSSLSASQKIAALRDVMNQADIDVHAYIIPSEDAHHSEYVSDHDKRREFISNFTGSAGMLHLFILQFSNDRCCRRDA